MQARGLLTSILARSMRELIILPICLRDLITDALAGRDNVDDFLNKYLSNHATREPSPEEETQARDISDGPETVARDDSATDAFIKAILNSRDGVDDILNMWSNHATREPSLQEGEQARDISDGSETVARDDSTTDAFIKAILNSRDQVDDILNKWSNHATREPSPQEEQQARDISDGSETVARDDSSTDAFIKAILNSRGHVDDILNKYLPNHATREPSPQEEKQARDIPDGPETVARDDSSTDAFIKAILNSRDSSKGLTADDVLSLASLASRALDDLD